MKKLLVLMCVVIVPLFGSLAAYGLLAQGDKSSGNDAAASASVNEVKGQATQYTVALSPQKLAVSGIETIVAAPRELSVMTNVPGRLVYDDDLHVEVRAPSDGVLVQVLVKPGDQVAAGGTLAWLESSEIGAARAEILRLQAAWRLAVRKQEFQSAVRANVRQAIEGLRERRPFGDLQQQLSGLTLGAYREQMMVAYSRWLLAQSLSQNAAPLEERGILAGNTMRVRSNELRAAEAALDTFCEQAEFDTATQSERANMEADDAYRRLIIAKRHLAALLMMPSVVGDGEGGRQISADSSAAPLASADELGIDEERISLVAVRSPLGGTIEERHFSTSERVQQGDSLFTVADTHRLWVDAEIRESDWNAIQIAPGAKIKVTTPALPEKELTATVYYVGREVAVATNAIPIVARIDNVQGLLRPGLFVRVELPVGSAKNRLAVPASALVQHEGEQFVFVEGSPGHFQRTDVATGIQTKGWVEITSGLNAGVRVVSKGAFLLKSELLLEGEE